MTKVTQDELDQVRDRLHTILYQWDSQDPSIQQQIKNLMEYVSFNLEKIEQRERSNERLKQMERQATARKRKNLRDELIPKWCERNLKPGMVVKVKANSATKFREIESVRSGHLTGRHVRYVRRRNLETLKFAHELTRDGYITDHVLRNVQAVVTGVDATGKPILTPIMELIEGA